MKAVRSFLGLAGYYRRFIENFSKIAKLMTFLLEKGANFVWTDERQAAFDELKKRLTTTPVLTLPDQSKVVHRILRCLERWSGMCSDVGRQSDRV